MRIAPVAATSVPTPTAPPLAAPAAPLAPAKDIDVRNSPAFRAQKKYGDVLFSMPGVETLSYSTLDLTTLRVVAEDERRAALFAGLLEDHVDDANIAIYVRTPEGDKLYTGGPGDIPYWDRIDTLSSMKGIWDRTYMLNPGGGSVIMRAVSQEYIDKIDPLIRVSVPVARTGTGKPGYLRLYWKVTQPHATA